MSGQISPRNETGNPLRNDRGSSTRVLLLVLLLLVAAAGYLYLFTDYIMPRKETVSLPPQPVQVKQPIPPRPGQTEAAKQGQVSPASPAAVLPPVTPAPAPAQAKGQLEQKPAPSPAKAEPAKVAQVPAPVKQAATAAPAPKPQASATAPPPSKPVAAAAAPMAKQQPAPAKTGEKAGKQAGKQAVKKRGGPFRLLIGDFGPDKALSSVQAKLKKCGISPVWKKVMTAAEPMNRIFVARYNDQENAEAQLGKVKKITGDAFLIADNGGYSLYAGSYLSADKAAAEQKKLGSRGVKTGIRKVKVPVRVTRVTAGSYASSEEALKAAALVKKHGIRATVIKMK
jgi:cell division septation protein DedD